MRSLVRVGALAIIVAGATIGTLWLSGTIEGSRIPEITLRTAGILAVLFVAAFAWRRVRGKTNVPDKTDQPVP